MPEYFESQPATGDLRTALGCVLQSLSMSEMSVYRTISWPCLGRACCLAGVCNTALWIVLLYPALRYPHGHLSQTSHSMLEARIDPAWAGLVINWSGTCDTVHSSSVVLKKIKQQ